MTIDNNKLRKEMEDFTEGILDTAFQDATKATNLALIALGCEHDEETKTRDARAAVGALRAAITILNAALGVELSLGEMRGKFANYTAHLM